MKESNVVVSVHIPKTGGSSLCSILKKIYYNRIQLMYGDDRDILVENPLCYHGHSKILKHVKKIKRAERFYWITFLREPLCSAVSLYYYGKRKGMIKEISLYDFLTNENNAKWPYPSSYRHNRYSKWLYKSTDICSNFNFIGITEYFDKSMEFLSKKLDWPKVIYSCKNVGNYQLPKIDNFVREDFMYLNHMDYEIYNKAVIILKNYKISSVNNLITD